MSMETLSGAVPGFDARDPGLASTVGLWFYTPATSLISPVPGGLLSAAQHCAPALVQATQRTSPPSQGLQPWFLQVWAPAVRGAPSKFVYPWVTPSALDTLYEESIIIPHFQMIKPKLKEERALPEVTKLASRKAQIQVSLRASPLGSSRDQRPPLGTQPRK